MKLALLADLHANLEAVEAVLAHAREHGAERYAFLGDYVGYGADPGPVVDLVHEHVRAGAFALKGNHDHAVVAGPSPHMIPAARIVVSWTRERLHGGQLDFLAALPLVHAEADRFFVHADAADPPRWAYVTGRLEAARCMDASRAQHTFCGHVHEQRLFHLSPLRKCGDFTPSPDVPIALSSQRRWLAIAGSVGQPRDGNPAACYAMLDCASATLTFRRVPYDHEAAMRKIRAAGLPQQLARRLADGL